MAMARGRSLVPAGGGGGRALVVTKKETEGGQETSFNDQVGVGRPQATGPFNIRRIGRA